MVYPRVLNVVLWIGQSRDQCPIVGKQQQAFAVAVQPPRRVHTGHINKLLECGVTRAFIGKLRKNPIWFIEKEMAHIRSIMVRNQREEQAMANQYKVVVTGKVQKESSNKFKIKKEKNSEVDIDIEIEEEGDYQVDKLSVDGLPTQMYDGNLIRWFNNFSIKKNGQYINQKYKVTIPGVSNLGSSKLVIFDGNGDPYYYTGAIVNDTFELTDGDPATGQAP